MENHFIDKDVDRHVYKDINADMDVGTIDKQNVCLSTCDIFHCYPCVISF